jgi:prepilin-type N-terminal cleavage/methylation domain-containing protein
MSLRPKRKQLNAAFTLVEVLIAIAVVVMSGAAAFYTNERLLGALRSQKETTAATMALQWRMEKFLRATTFANLSQEAYVKNQILNVRTATLEDGSLFDPFAPLKSVTEQITVGPYWGGDPSLPSPTPSPIPANQSPTVVLWNSANSNGLDVAVNPNLGDLDPTTGLPKITLLKVDILLTWSGPDNRSRSRQLSSVFGMAIGQ